VSGFFYRLAITLTNQGATTELASPDKGEIRLIKSNQRFKLPTGDPPM